MNRQLPSGLRLINGFRRWLVVAAVCGAPLTVSAGDKPIEIFVSIMPQKHFVERIGGKYVNVHVMVGPGQSPHTYELTPKQMVKLSEADIYFRMGIPFETVLMDRIRTVNPDATIIDARETVELRAMEHGEILSGGDNGGGHNHGSEDPHLWTDPQKVKKMMQRFTEVLAERFPRHGDRFRANYRQFAASLDELDRNIQAIFQETPRKPFLVFHPSLGYFADRYGLTQMAIEWEGKTPNAKELAAVIDYAKRHGIRRVFVQKQFSSQEALAVANAIGGEVIAIDPLAEDYIDNLLEITRLVAGSMR